MVHPNAFAAPFVSVANLGGAPKWRDALPESLAGSATAELLEQVCDLDLSVLEAVELPRGFGRDG
ncbi:MAG: hypothetical protein OXG04_09080 [Acidobacteria bacterium]|nr:hypothetical protein [Acidobacteriota bacterium]